MLSEDLKMSCCGCCGGKDKENEQEIKVREQENKAEEKEIKQEQDQK